MRVSRNPEYIDEEQYKMLNTRLESIRKPLIGLIKYFKQRYDVSWNKLTEKMLVTFHKFMNYEERQEDFQ